MGEYICPHCKKPVYDDEAILCLYCGESLGRSIGFMGSIKSSRFKIIAIASVILVLISFVLLMIR